MAETKYEIGLLQYTCDTYESALEFLNTFGKHKPGQPICVFYGDEDTGTWNTLFAIGIKAPNTYQIIGSGVSSGTGGVVGNIKWYVINTQGNTATDQNTFKPIHIDYEQVTAEIQNSSNLIFAKVDGSIGYIYHNGVQYSSPYLNDYILKEDIVIDDEHTITAGSTIQDILETIYTDFSSETAKVTWGNIEDIPSVEEAFDMTDYLKTSKALSEFGENLSVTAAINLLKYISGTGNFLKYENNILSWDGVDINWYTVDGEALNQLVRFTKLTREEYNEIPTPANNILYFISSSDGIELRIGNQIIKAATYTLEAVENPVGYQAQYILKDSAGGQCGATINIPLDKVVSNATLKTVTEEGVPYDGATVGDKYIDIEFSNQASHVYIRVQDLVDIYFTGNGIDITDHRVSVNYITKVEIDEIFEQLEAEKNNE